VTTDPFTANVFKRFGVEFTKSLVVPNTRYIVGRFDLTLSSIYLPIAA
jgi:hypothetical protein